MSVNFYLDNRTDKNGDAPIRVSVTIKGTRLLTSSGLKIPPSKWNPDKQKIRQGASNAAGQTYNILNAILAKIANRFAAYEAECISKNSNPDTGALRRELAAITGRGSKQTESATNILTFWNYYDKFTNEMGTANHWTLATIKKFATLRKHLTVFNEDLTFEHLNDAGLTKLVTFFMEKCDMRNTTVDKQIGLIKWFLRWATSKGYNTNTAFKSYSPKLKTSRKKVIFLEWDELMKIWSYNIPANGTEVELTDAEGDKYIKTVHDAAAIAKARDMFCFCCFTSLRYSDAVNLKWSDINDDTFTITTIKTADTVTIELNKYARKILDRYAVRNNIRGYVFPRMTNQRMNIYLKDLCELCGISQPVTQVYYRGSERIEEVSPKYELIGTHCGRRTFICNALMLGIPAEIVMKWTGHSDYESMKPYIAIADAAKAKAMTLFDKI